MSKRKLKTTRFTAVREDCYDFGIVNENVNTPDYNQQFYDWIASEYDRSYHAPDEDEDDDVIQKEFDDAFKGKEDEFKQALLEARDYLGALLAHTWKNLGPHHLNYGAVGLGLLSADMEITGGRHQSKIRESFAWREITFPADSIAFVPHSLDECGLLSRSP